MVSSDTVIVSLAFIFLVAVLVATFVLQARAVRQLSVVMQFSVFSTFSLWAFHGFLADDAALTYGAGLGALIQIVILSSRFYNRAGK